MSSKRFVLIDDLDDAASVAFEASSFAVEGFNRRTGFRVLSKQKSFYLRCDSESDKNEWFRLIDYVANEV